MVNNRDEVILALNSMDIYPGVHYRDNIHYSMYTYAEGTCPAVRKASDSLISLPIHMNLTRSDIVRVANALISIVEH